ncbi:uncharacterized protein LOC131625103 [Vicia villosa]|uniref:uncharacterized protein LOC131625103 n=1 Tax=Vicia villosa TaxID=3911 RepID=UPI00273A80F9|nr:uncharacterized protein LOC131625103 [Vicia villosa]
MAATAPCANSPRLNPQFARTAANGRTSELKTGILQLICASPFAGLDHEDPYTHLTRFYELAEKFLEQFYSQNRFFDAKTTIAVFSQGSNESLNEAWERFKAMLRKCKGHGFAEVDQIHMFRNGLTPTNKTLLDATAGGSLMSKTTAEAIEIIERMALNDRQSNHDRTVRDKKPGLLELTNSDALLAQNKLLTSQVELLTQQMSKLPQQIKELNGVSNSHQVAKCELCKGDNQTGFCPPVLAEEVNYMNNNQGPRKNKYPNPLAYQQNYPPRNNNQGQKNQEAAIKNLETQVGQLAKQIAANQSNATFSANTQENPKEHCKAVVTRTGQKGGEKEVEINGTEKEDDNRAAEEEENEVIVSNMNENTEGEIDETKKGREGIEKRKSTKKKMSENVIPSQHLPYPHAPSKKDNARQYSRFMSIFNQLHINIPFAEALEQMPKYAKFMMSMLTKKKNYTDEETVVLDAQCNAVIQRTTPRKESDPRRVTLPLNIGGNFNRDGLIDLGSSINLIPLSIVKKLGNIVMTPTSMTLQLADKSITSPYGVIQDLLVKMQPAKRGSTKSTSTGPRGAHPREPLSKRFLGTAQKERFAQLTSRTILPEKLIVPKDDSEYNTLWSYFEHRNWDRVFEPYTEINMDIVREFYANAIKLTPRKCNI